MNNTLLQQQLELHFGEDYPNVVSQAERFCKALIGRPWWGRNRSVLLNNEGGLPGMLVQSLIHIIEGKNIGVGLKTYGLYLRSEYGRDKLLHTLLSEHSTPTQERQPAASSSLLGESTAALVGVSSDLQSLYDFGDKSLRTAEEQDFFLVYASVGSITEAANLLGITREAAKRIYFRVHKRAMRQVQAQA